ncbi:MAG: FecR domain-containing protein [Planctomycetes bacterium]|nr:FecR domain-containing protein [Planctomycetota bacterium]
MKTCARILVCLLLVPPCFAGKDEAPVGKVSAVSGESSISHNLKNKAIAVGDSVYEKDKIKTGDDGEVIVELSKAQKITIGPKSYFKINTKTTEKTDIGLYSGGLRAQVAKLKKEDTFEVRTPSAVAGVRGTELGAQINDQYDTYVDCTEGEVAVRSTDSDEQETRSVSAGEASLTTTDGTIIVIETRGVNAAEKAKYAADKEKSSAADGAMNELASQGDLERAERLQELEERIGVIEGRLETVVREEASGILPGVPEPPSSSN